MTEKKIIHVHVCTKNYIYRGGQTTSKTLATNFTYYAHTDPLLIEQTIIKLSNQKGEPIK